MTAFKRLSVGPTVPDLLRRDAERRTAQSCLTLPAGAWCRTAIIAVARNHRLNGSPYGLEPMTASDRQKGPTRLQENLVPVEGQENGPTALTLALQNEGETRP